MAKKSTIKKKALPEIEEDLDLTQGMGIMPEGIPFTKNIGCVGGSSKTDHSKKK